MGLNICLLHIGSGIKGHQQSRLWGSLLLSPAPVQLPSLFAKQDFKIQYILGACDTGQTRQQNQVNLIMITSLKFPAHHQPSDGPCAGSRRGGRQLEQTQLLPALHQLKRAQEELQSVCPWKPPSVIIHLFKSQCQIIENHRIIE